MKHTYYLGFVLMLLLLSISIPSCQDYEFLDKPPGTDVTEDTVFNTVKDFEKFLTGTYYMGIHSYYTYHSQNGSVNPNPTMCPSAPIADEGEGSHTWLSAQDWNAGLVVKNNIVKQEDVRFYIRWKAIRRCNIIIERIPDTDFPDADKKSYAGEAYFIRALNNFEMFKRYGGMPIVDKRLVEGDNWSIPRASVNDFVEYIVSDCDESAKLLKGLVRPASQRGRITESAALALKAKVLLYAASPLFNTAEPYLPSSHPELVCYGNYSAERWKRAADAAKAALDCATAAGHALYYTGDAESDYRNMWSMYDNQEIILAEKYKAKVGGWTQPWCHLIMSGLGISSWGTTVLIPQNFIYRYEKMDGTPMEWNAPGVRGNDIMEKFAQLDPRFRQTVAYNGSEWSANVPELQLYQGGGGVADEGRITGYMMHKTIPYELGVGSNSTMTPNGIVFRVGELYLDLAEALNEYAGPTADVYEAIKPIRDRAGMPQIPSGLSKDEMRERIKNERAIELCYEDHRVWDLRRWMDAEKDGAMRGAFYKVVMWKVSGSGLNMKCDYEIQQYETRTFHRKMYLHPIMESEVNKGYLEQNPGW